MVDLNVITLHGSLRAGSYNRQLARALPGLAPDGMTITESPAWDQIPIYNADDQANGFPAQAIELSDAIRAADGVIFVTPEYNYGMPGGLKNVIDWISRIQDQPFRGKPVAIQSATTGPVGGVRVQVQLRQILVFLEALAFNKPEVFVGLAPSKFENGELKDPTTIGFIRQQLAGFDKLIRGSMANV